jgi:LmbE family N-acetylglucosaminyl deacetylase
MMRPRGKWQWLLAVIAALIVGAAFNVWLVTTLQYRRALRKEGFVGELPAPHAGDRILVIAPHPDDEVIGCGGLIQRALADGAQVHVALMTNGDGSELALIFGERDLPLRPTAFTKLGLERQQESIEALGHLGLKSRQISFLGYPNNGLLALWQPEHWGRAHLYRAPNTHASRSPYANSVTRDAAYCGEQVLGDLTEVLREVRPTMVFLTHPLDIHPDHWTTDAFARYALATLAVRGEAWARETRVYGYLVHWPAYPAPRRFLPRLSLLPPPNLLHVAARWQKLPLTKEEVRRKLQAVRLYHSQLPNLDRLLLAFVRENEMFAELPPVSIAGPVTWRDEAARLRRMGGADVSELHLRLSGGDTVAAEVITHRAKIPGGGYVAVDLRGWDDRARPVIATAYVDSTGTRAVTVDAAGRIHRLRVTTESAEPGRISLAGLPWPGGAARDTAFVTCWGKGRGRLTDPAVVAVVER